MAKYKISVPDVNKYGIKLSGVKSNKNPFKVLGKIILKVSRDGWIQYEVITSDFEKCFPIGAKFYSITDMLTTGTNEYVTSYGEVGHPPTYNFEQLMFPQSCILFSKHKIDDKHWEVIIYNPEDDRLYEEIEKYHDFLLLRNDKDYSFEV